MSPAYKVENTKYEICETSPRSNFGDYISSTPVPTRLYKSHVIVDKVLNTNTQTICSLLHIGVFASWGIRGSLLSAPTCTYRYLLRMTSKRWRYREYSHHFREWLEVPSPFQEMHGKTFCPESPDPGDLRACQKTDHLSGFPPCPLHHHLESSDAGGEASLPAVPAVDISPAPHRTPPLAPCYLELVSERLVSKSTAIIPPRSVCDVCSAPRKIRPCSNTVARRPLTSCLGSSRVFRLAPCEIGFKSLYF